MTTTTATVADIETAVGDAIAAHLGLPADAALDLIEGAHYASPITVTHRRQLTNILLAAPAVLTSNITDEFLADVLTPAAVVTTDLPGLMVAATAAAETATA